MRVWVVIGGHSYEGSEPSSMRVFAEEHEKEARAYEAALTGEDCGYGYADCELLEVQS